MNYKVVERFVSINGEGLLAGQLAVFIRLAGCNLLCNYCDTLWANKEDVKYELLSEKDIYNYIISTGIKNITITGGEPLIQDGIEKLIEVLVSDTNIHIEIETNGSIDIRKYLQNIYRPSVTMDYKLPSSGMEHYMLLSNLNYLNKQDVIKFVIGNINDLKKAHKIINDYKLQKKTNIYFSPVYNQISLEDIITYMKQHKLNEITFQLQLHKVIWSPDKKGV